MHVDVHGETAHAGPTPMDRRRNALGAAMLSVAENDIGWKYHATEGKATVPRLITWPNEAGILSDTPRSHATSVTPIRPSPTRCGPKSRRPWVGASG